eukprot:6519397-Pyramimonas_sp.AAC.2
MKERQSFEEPMFSTLPLNCGVSTNLLCQMANAKPRVLEKRAPLGVGGAVEVQSFWHSAGPAE